MSRYSDFELVFGKESLQCSWQFRNAHRKWVQIVGEGATDIIEWDQPDPLDAGVGAPVALDGHPELGFMYKGIEFTRPCRYYFPTKQSTPPPRAPDGEEWVAEMVQPLLEGAYPWGQSTAMNFPVLMPTEITSPDANRVVLLGLQGHFEVPATLCR